MTTQIVIQDFETDSASGAYGGTRRLSATTELMLITLYTYASAYRWRNANGEPLTAEQRDTIEAWTSLAQYELMEERSSVIGSIIPFVGSVIPDHALICLGGTYNRVDYPALYDVLVDNLIIDANTFQVPNFRGRMPRGTGTDPATALEGGADEFTLDVANLPPHAHSYIEQSPAPGAFEVGPIVVNTIASALIQQTGSTGSADPKRHLPRYVNVKYIIIAK